MRANKRQWEATDLDRRGFLALLAGATAGLAGLSLPQGIADAASASKTIGFGYPYRTVDVYKPIIAGAREVAAQRGYTILESYADGQADKQLAEINTWIGEGVPGMTILPIDQAALAPAVQRAHAAGIKVVGYSDQIRGEDGYNIFDHHQGAVLIGTAAGRYIKEKLGGKAHVALLTLEELQVGRTRIHDAVRAMQKIAPGATIVASAEANVAAAALTATQTLLQAHPEIDVMICVDDDDIIGAHQAFVQAGRSPHSVWLAGYDGSRAAMQKILSNEIIGATAALPLKNIGRLSIALPANLIEHKTPTSWVHKYLLVDNSTPALAKQLIGDFGS